MFLFNEIWKLFKHGLTHSAIDQETSFSAEDIDIVLKTFTLFRRFKLKSFLCVPGRGAEYQGRTQEV